MTLAPPAACQRIAQLHAMMGSPNGNEANTAREKIIRLLAEHGCTWNDVQEILAAARSGGRANAMANGSSPAPLWGYFFHSPDGTAYADIHIDGHRKTWPVRSRVFQDHVRGEIFQQTGFRPRAARCNDCSNSLKPKPNFAVRNGKFTSASASTAGASTSILRMTNGALLRFPAMAGESLSMLRFGFAASRA